MSEQHQSTRRSPILIGIDLALCFSLAFSPLLANASQPGPTVKLATASGFTESEAKEYVENSDLLYWAQLDHEQPELTEAFLGQPKAEVAHLEGTSLVDADPFFMRSQSWTANSDTRCEANELCFSKSAQGVQLTLGGSNNVLTLNQPLTPLLNTERYLILVADQVGLFAEKTKGEEGTGEGIFFINKADIVSAAAAQTAAPVFFFPLPGFGWTRPLPPPIELKATGQIVLLDQERISLPIDVSDFDVLEQVQRSNLVLAQTATLLESNFTTTGVPLPMPYSTAAFGLVMSGLLPKIKMAGTTAQSSQLPAHLQTLVTKLMSQVALPQANAEGEEPTRLQKLRAALKAKVKPWLAPIVMYGTTAAAAVGMYDPEVMSQMIPDNFTSIISHIGQIIAGVTVASVTLKYTLYRDYFAKKYPKLPTDSILKKIHQEHKGIGDSLAYGLYFSIAIIPQGLRHILEILKDKTLPTNRIVHKAWHETMGFQMRQNSRLAMNWLTQYLGWWHGFLDSTLVGVHLLILAPWLAHHFGLGVATGSAVAAYASAEVIRNFLAYLQSGAHNYSADIKGIHMGPAEQEAKRKFQASTGKDPNSALNEAAIQDLTAKELAKIYESVGLPPDSEFLYDPLTFFEWLARSMGYSIDGLTPEQKKELAGNNFVLTKRRWGLVAPALKRALQMAKEMQAKNPTETGRKTVELLEWAIQERSITKAIGGRVIEFSTNRWSLNEMRESIEGELQKAEQELHQEAAAADVARVQEALNRNGEGEPVGRETPGLLRRTLNQTRVAAKKQMAVVRGALKYFAADSTQVVRDINKVVYLGSSTSTIENINQFLPQSWKDQAQTPEVARAGAGLIQRSFLSLFEGKPEARRLATNEDRAAYGDRATKILNRLAENDPPLNDPFIRSLAQEELIGRLKEKTEARQAIIGYKPKALSFFEAKQWDSVRAITNAQIAELDAAEAVAPEWSGMVENFNANVENKADAAVWSKAYKYRFAVAFEMAKKVGLEVSQPEDSDLVQRIMVKAAMATEEELGLEKHISYMKGLNESDRKFYEAQLFYRHFIASYTELTVRSDEFDGRSPEYPGFQKTRRWMLSIPGGKVLNNFVAVASSVFRNESTSYLPGFWSWASRNVPIISDLAYNFVRAARAWPYYLTLGYLSSYYIWSIHIPYSMWVAAAAFGFVHPTIVEMVNRLMKNFGIKPMNDMPSKSTFSFVHSNTTNMQPIVVQNYAPQIQAGFQAVVVNPINHMTQTCADMLKRVVGL